jgi:hypothetical protein
VSKRLLGSYAASDQLASKKEDVESSTVLEFVIERL